MSALHVVVPAGLDDPTRPSGGNVYDLRVCEGLSLRGWAVHRHDVAGAWPRPSTRDRREVAHVLRGLPDGSVVLVDGLVGSAVGAELAQEAGRLRLVLLVHLPLSAWPDAAAGKPLSDREAVRAARHVIVPSRWCADWLVREAGADPTRITVAPPGCDAAPLTQPSTEGGRLLTVGAVTHLKGQARIVSALASVADLPWSWTCVGSMAIDPASADAVHQSLSAHGLWGRVRFTGALDPHGMQAAYADADVLLVGSRVESYGMVVTEALARGIPVLAPRVGGLAEALGPPTEHGVPGLLIDGDGPESMAAALRGWLTDGDLRSALRMAAAARRGGLLPWEATVDLIERTLLDCGVAR